MTIVGRVRFAIAAALALGFAPLDAAAGESGAPPVGVGEVGVAADSRDVDVDALRSMVVEAVGALDVSAVPKGAHAIVSVSVVRLDARDSSPAEVTCVVSATLRDATRGSVFAVLEGSAHGQDEPRRLRGLRRATMRAAVASAISRVPEAMNRRHR
jgi:hypothetical protein